jgi:uncharacterized repeat protein (TIGR03803 family)
MARRFVMAAMAMVVFVGSAAWGVKGKEYGFKGSPDGAFPLGSLVSDGAGNFYCATTGGGRNSYGAILKFSANQNGRWAETVIYAFTGGVDGRAPQGSLVFDRLGNLYGTTTGGGGTGNGTVFRLSPNQGGAWTEEILYSFQGGADGSQPASTPVFDAAGNLYGTTQNAGVCVPSGYCGGTVFKLTPNQGNTWSESPIYSFPVNQDQLGPTLPSGVTFDSSGNLYGTRYFGGTLGWGAVFELTPNPDGSWTENTPYNFTDGLDGGNPTGGVTFDSAGNLYGEASRGGSFACPEYGCGVIFKLAPSPSGGWEYAVAYTFDGIDGRKGTAPYGGLVFDTVGDLYGTTNTGGDLTCFGFDFGCGTVFRLILSADGATLKIMAEFDGVDGAFPVAGVIVDKAGVVYGTAEQGGNLNCEPPYGCGVVFMLTPGGG